MSIKHLLTITLISLFLIGCSSTPRHAATQFSSYDDFVEGPVDGVDLVWARIGLRDEKRLKRKLAQYDSIVLDRIFVVIDEESTLDDDEIKEVTAYLEASLAKELALHKKIVTKPTETTLRLSIAISNIETPNPVLAVTSSVLPFGIGMSMISKVTTGEHTNVGSASIELMVSDALSKKPLFAVIDRQSGNKDLGTIIDSTDDAKDAIDWWIERLGITLTQWKQK